MQFGTHVWFHRFPVVVWNEIPYAAYKDLLGTAYQFSLQLDKICLDNYAIKVVLIKFYGFPISE